MRPRANKRVSWWPRVSTQGAGEEERASCPFRNASCWGKRETIYFWPLGPWVITGPGRARNSPLALTVTAWMGETTFITSNIDLDLSPPLSLSSLERFDPTQLKARVHYTLCTPPACPPAWLPSANLPADISPFLFIFHHRRARLRTWP